MSDNLNTPQRDAVRYMDGPCLVLAGAGSGKTRVITQKIAYLIETGGYEAKHIAALTFTNKAASEMQERVAKILQEPKLAKQITVSTFHSLGIKILRQEASSLGLKERFSIMDAQDCFAMIQDLAVTTDKQIIRRIQSAISLWKNNLITPECALAQARSEDEAQHARIYHSYVTTLKAYSAIDFDDLICFPVMLFRTHEDIREKWQRRLRYLLVDEYQDTNTCQYELIKLLVTGVGKKPMFTAVGDDDQAIYAWRGATIENLNLLQKDFTDLRVIKLEQNYRSTTRILQAANAVIANNPKSFEKQLWSEHGLGEPICITALPNDDDEAKQIAMMISTHRFERRTQFSDYAILYRGNHQARLIEQALRAERIPYTISGGQSFFDRAEIKDVVSYLRLIANQDDDPAFIRAATTPKRGIGSTTLETLGRVASQWQCSLFDAAYKGSIETELAERQLISLREFCTFILNLETLAAHPGEDAAKLLDDMMKEICYEEYLYNTFDDRQAQAKWKNVLDFIGWLKEKGIGDKMDHTTEKNLLELTQMVTLMTMLDGKNEELNAVRMSTLHAAKGLEFPHVFLVGVEEGILPHKGDKDAPAETMGARIEEERRLMYVGITRAKRTLHLTWCKKRRRAGELAHCEISRFVDEMKLQQDELSVSEKESITPQKRLANLKALLTKSVG